MRILNPKSDYEELEPITSSTCYTIDSFSLVDRGNFSALENCFRNEDDKKSNNFCLLYETPSENVDTQSFENKKRRNSRT